MYKDKRFIAFIPARGGSQGIRLKNMAPVGGKPLVAWSIQAALGSRHLDGVYVSTDHAKIAKTAKRYNALVVKEPPRLARSTSPIEPAILHALKEITERSGRPDYIVLLQPTSPIRGSRDIDKAIEQIMKNKGDSLLSVAPHHHFIWNSKHQPINYDARRRPRRQNREPEWRENGSIYITKMSALLKNRNRLAGKIVYYPMSEACSIEIDNPYDLWLADITIRREQRLTNTPYIELLVVDVDGVMTDGSTYYGKTGEKLKRFNKRDGKGIELWHRADRYSAIITGETSPVVRQRARDLHIPTVFEGYAGNKSSAYVALKKQTCLPDNKIAFIGDDIIDLPVLRQAGFSACPADAEDKVKAVVDYVCKATGGHGCVREVINLLLKQ